MALAHQLQTRECEENLPDRRAYFPSLIEAAATVSPEVRDAVGAILSAPVAAAQSESIRAVRRRTARMQMKYPANLEQAAIEHLGDEGCARCVLGVQNGVQASFDWSSL